MATDDRAPWEVIQAAADELDAVLDGDLGNEWVHQAGNTIVESLVAWLRVTADSVEQHVPVWEATHPSGRTGPGRTAEQVAKLVDHHFGHALALSRAILGEPQ